jgi:hypothetical protein
VIPVDDTHVTAITMLAIPLVDGVADPAFRPGTDTETRDEEGNLLRQEIERVEAGADPRNIVRSPKINQAIPTNAYNRVIPPEAS